MAIPIATPTPTPIAAAATGTAGRSRSLRPSGTGCRNSSTGQERSRATRRNVRSGFTTLGCPTVSSSDLPLLESVGHPSAVNPDRSLRRVATERSWPILAFRHPVPLGRRLRDRPAVPVAAAALGVGVGVAIGIAIYGRHRRTRATVT